MGARDDSAARSRALNRLARLYPGVFKRLLAEELQSIGWEQKKRLVAQCGTPSGAHRHQRLGEPMCDPCREATNAYQRSLRARKRADLSGEEHD